MISTELRAWKFPQGSGSGVAAPSPLIRGSLGLNVRAARAHSTRFFPSSCSGLGAGTTVDKTGAWPDFLGPLSVWREPPVKPERVRSGWGAVRTMFGGPGRRRSREQTTRPTAMFELRLDSSQHGRGRTECIDVTRTKSSDLAEAEREVRGWGRKRGPNGYGFRREAVKMF